MRLEAITLWAKKFGPRPAEASMRLCISLELHTRFTVHRRRCVSTRKLKSSLLSLQNRRSCRENRAAHTALKGPVSDLFRRYGKPKRWMKFLRFRPLTPRRRRDGSHVKKEFLAARRLERMSRLRCGLPSVSVAGQRSLRLSLIQDFAISAPIFTRLALHNFLSPL